MTLGVSPAYDDRAAWSAELDGVGQELLDDLLELLPIEHRYRRLAGKIQLERLLLLDEQALNCRGSVPNDDPEIDERRMKRDRARLETGNVEQVIDHAQQKSRASKDVVDEARSSRRIDRIATIA